MIAISINSFLLKKNIISTEQYGFTKNKSVTTNLLCCFNNWIKRLDNYNAVDVIYFDYSKAFDRVSKSTF